MKNITIGILIFSAGLGVTSIQAAEVGKEVKSITKGQVANVACYVSGDQTICETAEIAGVIKDTVSVAAVGATAATVVGASGAGIMSTLAAAGGPVTIAAGGGLGAANLMNETLYTDCVDQSACDAAQYGTYTGAAAGTVASAATVAAVGVGPAGLAAVGGTVGGGMAAGATLLVAAPVVAAAAAGGLVYWLASD